MSDTYEPKHGVDSVNEPTGGPVAEEAVPTPVEYQKSPSMMFSNQTYDKLKWVAQILLPAVGTFYFTLGELWHLPNVGQVVGTITAADVFLGALLAISTKAFEKSGAAYDGTATLLNRGDGQTGLALNLNAHPDDLAGQKQVVLKVNAE